MFEKIKERYLMYYITDEQLDRYVSLGVITNAQTEELRKERNGGQEEV